MERVTDQEESKEEKIEIFANSIESAIFDFCDRYGIADLAKESQSRWNACLMYVNKQVFPDRSVLKDKTIRPLSNGNINGSNYNIYDFDILNGVLDIYLSVCLFYDKEVSIVGYSLLTGINDSTINSWANFTPENNRLSYKGKDIYKKLIDFRQESLTSKLQGGKANVVGILAILNRFYSWNMPGVTKESKQTAVLTVQDLPKLSTADGQKAEIVSGCADVTSE